MKTTSNGTPDSNGQAEQDPRFRELVRLSRRMRRIGISVCEILAAVREANTLGFRYKPPLDDETVKAAVRTIQDLRPEDISADEDETATASGYTFEAVDSEVFFTTDYRPEWLVKRLLIKGQPAILGGPRKCLKTSLLVDLAISLASGTPFLGHFDIYQQQRVVLISGESGEATIQNLGRRICEPRGLNPRRLNMLWSFRLPQLARAPDLDALRRGLEREKAQVAMIEPLYLCLLAGLDRKTLEAGNIYQMGPLLLGVARACLDVGVLPILAHHGVKSLSRNFDPMELDDLAFSGCAEFARQWFLLNRREPFDLETGGNKLWFSVGGSAGQCGLWAVDVEEGLLGDNLLGRKWEVDVRTASEKRGLAEDKTSQKRQEKSARKEKEDDAQVLKAIDEVHNHKLPSSKSKVREFTSLNAERFSKAVARLQVAGLVRTEQGSMTVGKGAVREVELLLRTRRSDAK